MSTDVLLPLCVGSIWFLVVVSAAVVLSAAISHREENRENISQD